MKTCAAGSEKGKNDWELKLKEEVEKVKKSSLFS